MKGTTSEYQKRESIVKIVTSCQTLMMMKMSRFGMGSLGASSQAPFPFINVSWRKEQQFYVRLYKEDLQGRTRSQHVRFTTTKGLESSSACTKERKAEIKAFLKRWARAWLYQVILTGAGTSAYVGIAVPCRVHDERHWNFNPIATTDIVAHPQTYLKKEVPTVFSILCPGGVSQKVSPPCGWPRFDWWKYQVTVHAERKTGTSAWGWNTISLLLQPKETNDAGFALTSSFTSMLLELSWSLIKKRGRSRKTSRRAGLNLSEILEERFVRSRSGRSRLWARDLSGGRTFLFGPQLMKPSSRFLELTAGKIATMYEVQWFRHGQNPSLMTNYRLGLWILIIPVEHDLDPDSRGCRDQHVRSSSWRIQAAGIEHVRVLVDASAGFP